MEEIKIYGICLERLNHQIKIAKERVEDETHQYQDRCLLECYNTGELDDIIDILELYDVDEKTFEQVKEKLEELSYTVSVLTHETLTFDFTQNGHLGLYLSLHNQSAVALNNVTDKSVAVAL
jgi:hypothetical protein